MTKWTVIYKIDGQTWTIQVDPIYDTTSKEDFENRSEYKYYLETENGLIECDKNKKAITK